MIEPHILENLKQMAKRLRLTILKMAFEAGRSGSHLGPALSCVEIMTALYGEILQVDPKNPFNQDRDRFIASKAHCVLALYSALNEKGFLSKEELDTFEKNNTLLAGHPAMDLGRGLEYSGGSLGMALSVCVGMALDAKQKNRTHRVFVLLGDGELNEGSNWEAFMSAAHFKLDNLTAIIDRNKLQYDGQTEETMALDNLGAKLKAFNWTTYEIDGHNLTQLIEAFQVKPSDHPLAIIANTIKGKGVSFTENNHLWHHGILSHTQYEQAVSEINADNQ